MCLQNNSKLDSIELEICQTCKEHVKADEFHR